MWDRRNQPWVARIMGHDAVREFRREFVRGHTSYAEANSKGSRGVYRYYHLDNGVYEVNERRTWDQCSRYVLQVLGEESYQIGKGSVATALAEIKERPEQLLREREKLGLSYPTAWRHLQEDEF